ncbi:MAG: hypothetical protein KIT09_17075 [Bryobacteraceae bacterium]|nr:hypothetical protein [Bryobacteraceae bacterium]
MNEYYLLLTPLAALAVLLLFRFSGCGSFGTTEPGEPPPPEPTFGIPYPQEVKNDNPAGYWRLNETTGTAAKNQVAGSPDGVYGKEPNPLPADAQRRSPAANPIVLQLGVGGPPTLLASDTAATSVRVQGAFARVPYAGQLNPPQFTLEALVFPEWNLNVLGKYYCLIESSSPDPAQPNTRKRFGYALYAGPADMNNPNTPYHWQLWVGNGLGTTFKPLTEVTPYKDETPLPPPAERNRGPEVLPVPAYLAVTYDGTKAFLYMYTKDRKLDHFKYELNLAPYKAASGVDLFIGITDVRRSLFTPFPGPNQKLYPFAGRIQEVAIYAYALNETRLASHANTAIEGI